MSERLVMVRHGPTKINREQERGSDIIQAQNAELAEGIGPEVAMDAGYQIAALINDGTLPRGFEIHSSPLIRAEQTVQIICEVLDGRFGEEFSYELRPELAERELPQDLEGDGWSTEDPHRREIIEAIGGKDLDPDFNYPGFETWFQMLDREWPYAQFLDSYDKPVIAVGHGGSLGLLHVLLERGYEEVKDMFNRRVEAGETGIDEYLHEFRLQNGKMRVLERKDGSWAALDIGV